MNRRTVLALGLLALAGCMDTPRDKPLTRSPTLLKRLGGPATIERIADAFSDQLLLADDISKARKESLLGPDKAAAHKKLVAQLTALASGGPLPDDMPLAISKDAPDKEAVFAALQRALEACKVADRDEKELLDALKTPPA
jgi:hypothetical protein